jgi:TrmH family RNA methyltransferase
VPEVLVTEKARGQVRGDATVLPDALFRTISSTETSQGVVALVRPPEWTIADLFGGCALVVVIDGVQDPGNAGAIVRAAEAFGASGVLFVKGSASPVNPKALRASAGSLFRVPFVWGVAAEDARAACAERCVKMLAAAPSAPAGMIPAREPCALIIGSEGRGVSAALREGAVPISIPTAGVESLNAAMAAGILLYEIRRQRMETA